MTRLFFKPRYYPNLKEDRFLIIFYFHRMKSEKYSTVHTKSGFFPAQLPPGRWTFCCSMWRSFVPCWHKCSLGLLFTIWRRKVWAPLGHSPPSPWKLLKGCSSILTAQFLLFPALPLPLALGPEWWAAALRRPHLSSFRVSNQQVEWQLDISRHHPPRRSSPVLTLCPPSPCTCKEPTDHLVPSLGAACWNWSTVWPLTIKQIFSAPATRFQSSVVQVEGGAPFSRHKKPIPMEV